MTSLALGVSPQLVVAGGGVSVADFSGRMHPAALALAYVTCVAPVVGEGHQWGHYQCSYEHCHRKCAWDQSSPSACFLRAEELRQMLHPISPPSGNY